MACKEGRVRWIGLKKFKCVGGKWVPVITTKRAEKNPRKVKKDE